MMLKLRPQRHQKILHLHPPKMMSKSQLTRRQERRILITRMMKSRWRVERRKNLLLLETRVTTVTSGRRLRVMMTPRIKSKRKSRERVTKQSNSKSSRRTKKQTKWRKSKRLTTR